MNDNKNKKTSSDKVNVNSLCKQIKVMRPGAVMQFIADQFGMSSAKFVAKNALTIAKLAIKNGWVKTKDIGASISNFSKKNKEDVTDIDFEKAEIDTSTTKFKCLFDNIGDKFSTFMKDLETELKDEGKEIEKADKQLHADVKKAGVDMDEKDIDENGLAVASVIDNKKNKGKKSKELKAQIDDAIKNDQQAKEIQKTRDEIKKSSSKVKVDKKYERMSDDELIELDDKINKKIKTKSDDSKKNDAFRSKIKNAVQKGVAEEFKKSVKTMFLSTDTLKKTVAKNMKPGLAVEQIEEPRAICVSVRCGKKQFKDVLNEAKDGDSEKVVDVTNGSKDKSIQNVIDYIKKVIQDKIGKDKLSGKTYAYLKSSGDNCLLYVFAGVKQGTLDESIQIMLEASSKELGATALKAILKYKEEHGLPGTMSQLKPSDSIAIRKLPEVAAWLKHGTGGRQNLVKNSLSRIIMKTDDIVNGTDKTSDLRHMLGQQIDKAVDVDNLETTSKAVAQAGDNVKDKAIEKIDNEVTQIEDNIHAVGHEQFGKVGFATYSDGRVMPVFSYQTMSRRISNLDDIFDDGKVDPSEMAKLSKMGETLKSYQEWAASNSNSDDPLIRQKVAMISKLSNKYNELINDNQDVLNTASQVDDARIGATEATRAASKDMANDEEVKKAAGDWKEKLGIGKAFTALGWARLAAKTTGLILNNGKAVVDALGAAAVKFKEDANIIAQMDFLLTNGGNNDAKFNDTKFSVRFSIDDMKWHATCLDDRKMKFDENQLIKKTLDSEEGKKFKTVCLKKWTSIFKPKDKTRQIIPYIMKNFDKIGLKASDSNVNKIVDTIQKMEDGFGTIEKNFK